MTHALDQKNLHVNQDITAYIFKLWKLDMKHTGQRWIEKLAAEVFLKIMFNKQSKG